MFNSLLKEVIQNEKYNAYKQCKAKKGTHCLRRECKYCIAIPDEMWAIEMGPELSRYVAYDRSPYICNKPANESNRTCASCKWYAMFEGVCCNGESEHCADFVDSDNTCEHWEEGQRLNFLY